MHILFVGGGTLGPVMPLLAVWEELSRVDGSAKASWIGTQDGPEQMVVAPLKIPFFVLPVAKWRRYWDVRNVTDVFRFVSGFFRAMGLLRRLRPDCVVSAGGFVAVPVVFAARMLGVRVHVHQLDLVPGLANRLSFPSAASISVSFPELASKVGYGAVFTGTPVREVVLNAKPDSARKQFGIAAGRPVVLVLGGGTGSVRLNALVVGALPALLAVADVIHVTGKGKMVAVMGDGYHPVEFLGDVLASCMALATVVVSRAGIGTIAELGALGKPAILVPLRGQQEENARYVEARGGCVVLSESGLTSEKVAQTVESLVKESSRQQMLGAAIHGLVPRDAARRVAVVVRR